MRLYEPVWSELKKKGCARVTAHRALHGRIIKAVTKEKWMDIGYKIEISPYYSILTHSSKGAVLSFTLTKKRNLQTLTARDF